MDRHLEFMVPLGTIAHICDSSANNLVDKNHHHLLLVSLSGGEILSLVTMRSFFLQEPMKTNPTLLRTLAGVSSHLLTSVTDWVRNLLSWVVKLLRSLDDPINGR